MTSLSLTATKIKILLNHLFLVRNPVLNKDGIIYLDLFKEVGEMLLSISFVLPSSFNHLDLSSPYGLQKKPYCL